MVSRYPFHPGYETQSGPQCLIFPALLLTSCHLFIIIIIRAVGSLSQGPSSRRGPFSQPRALFPAYQLCHVPPLSLSLASCGLLILISFFGSFCHFNLPSFSLHLSCFSQPQRLLSFLFKDIVCHFLLIWSNVTWQGGWSRILGVEICVVFHRFFFAFFSEWGICNQFMSFSWKVRIFHLKLSLPNEKILVLFCIVGRISVPLCEDCWKRFPEEFLWTEHCFCSGPYEHWFYGVDRSYCSISIFCHTTRHVGS